MRMPRLGMYTICGFMMVMAGCTTYYRVTRPGQREGLLHDQRRRQRKVGSGQD
jgi:hypothetical protein